MAAKDETLAKAMIAAALISTGAVDFKGYDEHGRDLRGASDEWKSLNSHVQRSRQARSWSQREHNWRENAALTTLRRLTDGIYRALDEPLEQA